MTPTSGIYHSSPQQVLDFGLKSSTSASEGMDSSKTLTASKELFNDSAATDNSKTPMSIRGMVTFIRIGLVALTNQICSVAIQVFECMRSLIRSEGKAEAPKPVANHSLQKTPKLPIVIENIVKVSDFLYTGESTAASGEPIYIGMEVLDAGNGEEWRRYRRACNHFCTIAQNISQGIDNGYSNAKLKRSLTGMTEEESDRLIDLMRSKRKELAAIAWVPAGIAGWVAKPGDFVIYISKTPIKERIAIPVVDKGQFNAQEFFDSYQHIVMSISARLIKEKQLVEIRGIFRNPILFMEGGYSGISMHLPSFVAKITQEHINPSLEAPITDLTVAPMNKMAEIFTQTIGRHNIKIEEEIPRERYHTSGSGIEDRVMLIPLSAL